jgi:hypothetical protein
VWFYEQKIAFAMWKVVVCITNACYECTYLISNKRIHTHMTLFCGFVLMMTDEVIQGRLGWIESFGWSWSSVIRFFPRWSPSNHQSRGWWICHSSPAHFQNCKSFISFLFCDWLKKNVFNTRDSWEFVCPFGQLWWYTIIPHNPITP